MNSQCLFEYQCACMNSQCCAVVSEKWFLNTDFKRKLYTTEMVYLRRSAGISRMEHIMNEQIKKKINVQDTLLDRFE